jgi:hypothetical protein
MTIEVITLDAQGIETDRRDFESVKEAKRFAIYSAYSADYWRMASESPDYAKNNVHTVQLHKNGECVQDWFPKFN